MASRVYNSRLYQRNREMILSSHPKCSVQGCPHLATTIDHIRPVSKGGNSELANLRPMCLSHNSSRGNREIIRYSAPF
jgi:5-methylcytosine-specific restriction endonuclease McrA